MQSTTNSNRDLTVAFWVFILCLAISFFGDASALIEGFVSNP